MTDLASPPRTRPIIARLPRTPAVLTPLSDPPRIIVTSRNGAKVAQANPDAIILDREAACIRRNLIRRSMRTERVRRLTEFVLRALPATEVKREDARNASGITADDNFSLCLRQVHHNLKPFGIGVASAYGGRVVIIGQEAAPC